MTVIQGGILKLPHIHRKNLKPIFIYLMGVFFYGGILSYLPHAWSQSSTPTTTSETPPPPPTTTAAPTTPPNSTKPSPAEASDTKNPPPPVPSPPTPPPATTSKATTAPSMPSNASSSTSPKTDPALIIDPARSIAPLSITQLPPALSTTLENFNLNLEELYFPPEKNGVKILDPQITYAVDQEPDQDIVLSDIIFNSKTFQALSGKVKDFAKNVEVVFIPGNHDRLSSYHLVHALSQVFKLNPDIKFNIDYKERKVILYGQNMFAFEHGDVSSKNNPLVYAVEFPLQWGSTTNRILYTGHYHGRKTKEVITENEEQGFVSKMIPALTSSDYYHYHNKWTGNKRSAMIDIHDINKGLISEFVYNV